MISAKTGKTALAILALCAAATLWGLGSREKRRAAPDASSAASGAAKEEELPLFKDRNGLASFPEKQTTEGPGPVQVTGVIRLVGSFPRTEPVLSNAEGEWYFDNDDQKRAAELQQRTVTVEGTYYEETVSLADNGNYTRRVLRAVQITALDNASLPY